MCAVPVCVVAWNAGTLEFTLTSVKPREVVKDSSKSHAVCSSADTLPVSLLSVFPFCFT